MLGLTLDPRFVSNRRVYWSYAEPRGGANNTAVARGTFTAGAVPRFDDVQVIVHQTPSLSSTAHFGGRLVFARDGTLFGSEERLLTNLPGGRERIRDVVQGPEGALYVLTDDSQGRILRLTPKRATGG